MTEEKKEEKKEKKKKKEKKESSKLVRGLKSTLKITTATAVLIVGVGFPTLHFYTQYKKGTYDKFLSETVPTYLKEHRDNFFISPIANAIAKKNIKAYNAEFTKAPFPFKEYDAQATLGATLGFNTDYDYSKLELDFLDKTMTENFSQELKTKDLSPEMKELLRSLPNSQYYGEEFRNGTRMQTAEFFEKEFQRGEGHASIVDAILFGDPKDNEGLLSITPETQNLWRLNILREGIDAFFITQGITPPNEIVIKKGKTPSEEDDVKITNTDGAMSVTIYIDSFNPHNSKKDTPEEEMSFEKSVLFPIVTAVKGVELEKLGVTITTQCFGRSNESSFIYQP